MYYVCCPLTTSLVWAGNFNHIEKIYCMLWATLFLQIYKGHLESKERFAIQRYLLIIGKKQNMQVLSHTFFTYFSTQSPWTLRHLSYRDTSLLIPSSYQMAAWLFIGSP